VEQGELDEGSRHRREERCSTQTLDIVLHEVVLARPPHLRQLRAHMPNRIDLTFLGTGTSVGVPIVGCECQACTSDDPRDNRLRASVLLELPDARVLVDCGPDLRTQCLRARITQLDAVLVTHPHSDHITGFDDLRRFTVGADDTLPVHAQPSCLAVLERMFGYAFNGENRYTGYLKPDPKPVSGVFEVGGARVHPLPVDHGKVECIGYLFEIAGEKVLAYIPDCKTISSEAKSLLEGVECLVVDALRHEPHPTHMSFGEALDVSRECGATQTWFTHISHEVLHARENEALPEGVQIAYDGLQLAL
jgi:phosphoribosyl 1,2-cyclic phosphate phosphodiesterase